MLDLAASELNRAGVLLGKPGRLRQRALSRGPALTMMTSGVLIFLGRWQHPI